jgi:hypothetical protein
VDEDIDVYNESEVLFAVATRFQGDQEVAEEGADRDGGGRGPAGRARDYETNSRENGWWLSQLVERYRLGEDPAALAHVPDSYAVLTPASVKAAAKLQDYLAENGFQIEKGVAGMPTAFVAAWGSGKPVIGQ